MNDATMNVLLGQLRTVLAAIGGLLVARGMITADGLNEIIGAVVICVPAIWSAWQKIQDERAAKAREVIAVNAGIAHADATAGVTPTASAATAPQIIAAAAAAPAPPIAEVPPPTPEVITPLPAAPSAKLPPGVAKP